MLCKVILNKTLGKDLIQYKYLIYRRLSMIIIIFNNFKAINQRVLIGQGDYSGMIRQWKERGAPTIRWAVMQQNQTLQIIQCIRLFPSIQWDQTLLVFGECSKVTIQHSYPFNLQTFIFHKIKYCFFHIHTLCIYNNKCCFQI